MQDVTLHVETREVSGKGLGALRAGGVVPGVVYGQGKQPQLVQATAKDVERAFHEAGSNRLVKLMIDGKKTAVNTLFFEVQHNPVKGWMLHFDLYKVRMDEKITTEIPIHFHGEAPAVYNQGGVLLKSMEEVEIEALPADLPEAFDVDVSALEEIGQAIHVSDLDVPKGVTVLSEGEEVIAKVDAPRTEEELEELETEVPEGSEAELVESEHGGEGEEGEESEGEAKEE